MGTPLNPKQLKFVKRYLATGNATQSYIDAGYKGRGRTAENNASRLLGNAGVKEAIEAATKKAIENNELTATWVLEQMQREARYRGKRSTHSARVKALELLGRRFGLFPTRHEHTGKNGAPIRINLSKLADDDLDRLDSILAAAEEPADTGSGAGGEGPAQPR